jgi:uncharacterized cupin superfamily protein
MSHEPEPMPAILHYTQPYADRQLPLAAFALHDDPLAAGRSLHFHDSVQGYAVGVSQSSGANLLIEDFPWVELGIVEAGELTLEGEGFSLTLEEGDCFVVPRGIALRWRHRGELRRLFMVFPGLSGSAEMPTRPLKIDLNLPLQPCNPPAANLLLTATPKAWSQTLFSSANLRIGLWECEAYGRKTVEPDYCELMHIIEGVVTLTPEQGTPCNVHAGETVVVPAGASNAWTSLEKVRKVFCILS